MKNTPKWIEHFEDLSKNYDVFVVDVYGVIHDGYQKNLKSTEVLQQLIKEGKKVILLTNAPKRCATVQRVLSNFQIPSTFYSRILTAGEEAFLCLSSAQESPYQLPGKKCYMIGTIDDILTGVDVERVDSLQSADFILVSGSDEWCPDLEGFESPFKESISRQIPMICPNPDKFVISQKGKWLRPGSLASFYEMLGGTVYYHGKPYGDIYEKILSLYPETPLNRVLCLGDGLETDILGANNAGLDSLFILKGMHENEVNSAPTPATLSRLFEHYKAHPQYVMPSMIW